MSIWAARAAWLGGPRLTENVTLVAEDGVFVSVSTDPDPKAVRVDGIVLPGLVNAHSHAFHRLLRGRTHARDGNFWRWRDAMYEIALELTPTSYELIATAVYIEMAMAGITTVGEFHYVHHPPGGSRYEDPNEMGHALIRAARTAGIRICLLDTGYFRAGFDDRRLNPAQERFSDGSADSWLQRVAHLADMYSTADDVEVGLAPHSVRAVAREDLRRVAEARPASKPVHVHVSEQPAENEACVEATGMTPSALLADTGLLDESTTLVHATHVTSKDIEIIGSAGSGVCYCATTERDLADGLGPAADLERAGASLSTGSDSHAVIDLFEETRGIEMHQRLRSGRRGVMDPVTLMTAATAGGAGSLGFPNKGLRQGEPADFIVVDTDSPRMTGLDPLLVESLVFAATAADVTDTFVGGKSIVSNRRHRGWEEARRCLTPPDR